MSSIPEAIAVQALLRDAIAALRERLDSVQAQNFMLERQCAEQRAELTLAGVKQSAEGQESKPVRLSALEKPPAIESLEKAAAAARAADSQSSNMTSNRSDLFDIWKPPNPQGDWQELALSKALASSLPDGGELLPGVGHRQSNQRSSVGSSSGGRKPPTSMMQRNVSGQSNRSASSPTKKSVRIHSSQDNSARASRIGA
mmetsp:Transcript_59936/g.111082  ORF Transcript_59936/g.111082 Transcript_59936/m.111082 type:complete len:200 (-) Transcript_59936:144-743(-)